MSRMNAFYAQSGGVTAVINVTACAVIETARKNKHRITNVYAGHNGIIGALKENMIDTNKETAATIAALRHTPGGAFGSARYKLKGIEENRAHYERLIEVFKAHMIDAQNHLESPATEMRREHLIITNDRFTASFDSMPEN